MGVHEVDVVVAVRFKVAIVYNGLARPLEIRPDEGLLEVLKEAIALFAPIPAPHTLGLFTTGGKELGVNETVKQAGIEPDEKLLLRPSQVRGGSR
jgi:hypothetical protein